jgi:hypothetical protein
LRISHLFIVGFDSPWNFGGLFLEFARQIYENNYQFPIIIPYYTLGGIPFAYPPLAFYIESFLIFTLGFQEFFIVNFLPPFFSCISLLFFIFLIKKIYVNKFVILFTSYFYAINPNTFSEQIQGSGLSESLGTLSIITLLFGSWLFYKNPTKVKNIIILSFCLTFSILSSPGSAYISPFVFFTFLTLTLLEKKATLKIIAPKIIIIILIVMILTSYYWINVIHFHGINLLLDSFINQHSGGFLGLLKNTIRSIANFDFFGNTPSNLLVFFGVLLLLYLKHLPFLILLLISIIIPRETWIVPIISIFLMGYVFDTYTSLNNFKFYINFQNYFSSQLLSFLFIIGILSLQIIYHLNDRVLLDPDKTLDQEQLIFLNSINNNSIPTHESIVIVGHEAFLEWSPYLSEKTVLNVNYGTEFSPSKKWIIDFKNQLKKCDQLSCIDKITSSHFDSKLTIIIDLKFFSKTFLIDSNQNENQNLLDINQERFLYYSLN